MTVVSDYTPYPKTKTLKSECMKRYNTMSETTPGIKTTKIYTHDFVGINAEVRDFREKYMAAIIYMQFLALPKFASPANIQG